MLFNRWRHKENAANECGKSLKYEVGKASQEAVWENAKIVHFEDSKIYVCVYLFSHGKPQWHILVEN